MSVWLDEEIRILRKYSKPSKTLNQVVDELKDKGFNRTKKSVEDKLLRERIYKLPNLDRVGYFDFEATALNSDFGWFLCFYIKEHGVKHYDHWSVTQKDILNHTYDLSGCKAFLKYAEDYDVLKGYFSKYYDSPMIKSRCLYWLARGKLTVEELKPISWGNLKHVDVWKLMKVNTNPHSRRMESLVKWLKIGEKTDLDPESWIYAQSGDRQALKYVNDHCKHDVDALEALTNLIKPFSPTARRESF